MKKTTLTGICLALALTAGAQTRGGGISAETMQKIEKMQTATPKAVFNAMASNKIDNLAKNFSNRTTFDNHFSVETPVTEHPRPEEFGKMLDVLRLQRAPF